MDMKKKSISELQSYIVCWILPHPVCWLGEKIDNKSKQGWVQGKIRKLHYYTFALFSLNSNKNVNQILPWNSTNICENWEKKKHIHSTYQLLFRPFVDKEGSKRETKWHRQTVKQTGLLLFGILLRISVEEAFSGVSPHLFYSLGLVSMRVKCTKFSPMLSPNLYLPRFSQHA